MDGGWLSGLGSAVSGGWDWFKGLFGGGGSSAMTPESTGSISGLAGGSYGPLVSEPGAAASAPTGGGGGGGWYQDIMGGLGSAAKAITPLVGLGTAGLGLYSGIKGMQEAADLKEQNQAALARQRQVADTALGSGTALTTAGTSALMGGPLPEGLEAQAKQWEDAYRAQVRNYLAKAGMTTSSAAAQWEPYIQQQAAIYRSQLAQGMLQPGQTSLQTASGAAAREVGQTQATQTGIGTALEAANRALASLQAASTPQKRQVA